MDDVSRCHRNTCQLRPLHLAKIAFKTCVKYGGCRERRRPAAVPGAVRGRGKACAAAGASGGGVGTREGARAP